MAKLTKKELQQVAKEFNKVMSLDPVIKMDKTNDGLLADIKEAAEELRDDDKFSAGVEKTLVALGIRKAVEEKKEEETSEPVKKEAKVTTTKPTKKSKETESCWCGVNHKVDSQVLAIDKILKKGSSLKAIAEKVGCSTGRVKSHLYTLGKKGFKVTENDKGVIKVAA
jgi:hypothetical protein